MDRVISTSEMSERLSDVLRDVAGGESFTVTDDGKAVARMVPIPPDPASVKKRPLLGAFKGQLSVGDEACKPLPDEYLGLDIYGDKEL